MIRKPVFYTLIIFLVSLMGNTTTHAQQLLNSGSYLLTVSRDTVPQGEVWKIVGSFGGGQMAVTDPTDTAAIAKKYRDMYNLRLENIRPQDLKGGMIMRDVLPVWLAEGSVFSVDPEDMMELFVERYRIVKN